MSNDDGEYKHPPAAQIGRDYAEAKKLGLMYYYGPKPCKHGHWPAVRYTAQRTCRACKRPAYAQAEAPGRVMEPPPSPQELLTTRSAALAHGDAYYKGVRCPQGHNGVRYASNGQCVMCQRDNASRYAKKVKGQKPGRKFSGDLDTLRILQAKVEYALEEVEERQAYLEEGKARLKDARQALNKHRSELRRKSILA